MDIYGLVVLLIALVLVACLQVTALFAAMFLLHQYAASHVPATTYGKFNFNHIEKEHLFELLKKICLIIFPPTLGLHVLEFMLVGIYIRAQPALTTLILFTLETTAIAVGLRKVLRLDQRRTIILTATSAVVYIFLYRFIMYADLSS